MKAERISKEPRGSRIVGRLIVPIRELVPAVLLMSLIAAKADVAFTSLYSFQVFTNGAYPNSLARGIDGNFYGTTSAGGTYGAGTVFKITTNGAFTRLYIFTGGSDGANPFAGLARGSDGNFYGTTGNGGANGYGTVFKITTNGVLTRLYAFTGGNDGAEPEGALLQGSDGNLYGTTYNGGTFAYGGVFKITTNGAFTRLYSFTGGNDGANPYSTLVQGSDGNFYGTAGYGGTNDFGTLFKITAGGVFTRLHLFTGGDDGSNPNGGLTQGSDGSFYGTADEGGTDNRGTIFKITANGDFTRLYSFTGGMDGAYPESVLVQGVDGNFYGTARRGGASDQGVAFQITANGVYTRLHSFTGGNDGAYPVGVLVQGNDGNFYGQDFSPAVNGGILFKMTTNGVLSTLYTFTGSDDGEDPYSSLVQGRDGNLYGTTYSGGASGGGIVFRISPSGVITNLYSFTGGNDGSSPQAGLVQGSDGNFYGATWGGGMMGFGTVFKITINGVLTTLHSLVFSTDGSSPEATLAQGKDGNFYGTAASGGTNGGFGTVFRFGTNGVLASLYSFAGGNDGANPYGPVMQGSDGAFYGTTGYGGTNNYGTVFKVNTNGAFTSLYSFTGGNDGANPYAGLAQASNGVLYGTTLNGGTNGVGTAFKITTNGVYNSIYSFTGGDDGGYPYGTLLLAKNGAFYGTTSYGTNTSGSVFKITTNGAVTALYSFTGGNDGASPQAGLMLATDGSFYGTAYGGGAGNAGTVFRITIAPAFKSLRLTNRTLNLTWSADVGSKYQLQYNSDLSPANWINFGGPVTATGATLSATDPLANNPRRFYRVVLLPQ